MDQARLQKTTQLLPASFSWDAYSWNSATMFWGSPDYMGRPHVSMRAITSAKIFPISQHQLTDMWVSKLSGYSSPQFLNHPSWHPVEQSELCWVLNCKSVNKNAFLTTKLFSAVDNQNVVTVPTQSQHFPSYHVSQIVLEMLIDIR